MFGFFNKRNIQRYTGEQVKDEIKKPTLQATIACKHKSSIAKIREKFKDGKGGWCVAYEARDDLRCRYFAKYVDSRNATDSVEILDNAAIVYGRSMTTFESRLRTKVCELCSTGYSARVSSCEQG
ncbi:MAG: hypothetical protein LBE76_09100 [Nitrososphaerota archaeon]|jgi:hypothetical protein|nr:hypothetical protein [Nitrososphaerota archaeon]